MSRSVAPAGGKGASPTYFSLGFSCQSRFAIDVVAPEADRGPFDFNITTKAAVLEGLRTAGRSFAHTAETGAVYRMPLQGREGIEIGGNHFWHEYPFTETGQLRDDWRDGVAATNAKYAFLWARFLEALARPGRKRFVVSNTQFNLPEFAGSPAEFEARFGLDAALFDQLTAELDRLTDDYDLVFIARSPGEAARLRAQVRDARLIVRFGGVQPLKCDARIARSALLAGLGGGVSALDRLHALAAEGNAWLVSAASRPRG